MTEHQTSNELLLREFPSLEHGLYVNHAAISPWPRRSCDAVTKFAEENKMVGPANYRAWIAREHTLRQNLSQFIGASSPGDIAFLKNTTEGISLVASGLDWNRGDNMVLPGGEFSSNRLPWLAQEARGVEIREVDIRISHNPEDALLDAFDKRTRVLSVSAVQWNDGFRLDLEALGESCRSAGVLFFVDAIQQLGALPLDVTVCKIDCLAADAHKWLLGPEGIAIFYCRDEIRPRLQLLQHGWHMFDNPWGFNREDWNPSSTSKRFEAGSPNSIGQAALEASLSLLVETGMNQVSKRIMENTNYLFRNISSLPGLVLNSRTDPRRSSGIVSFAPKDLPALSLFRLLSKSGVTSGLRDGSIRLSPHYYQREQQMEDLMSRIELSLKIA
jgi:selenocysteine lyase/cysteine desulfurase